jgi:hypothetical protein
LLLLLLLLLMLLLLLFWMMMMMMMMIIMTMMINGVSFFYNFSVNRSLKCLFSNKEKLACKHLMFKPIQLLRLRCRQCLYNKDRLFRNLQQFPLYSYSQPLSKGHIEVTFAFCHRKLYIFFLSLVCH